MINFFDTDAHLRGKPGVRLRNDLKTLELFFEGEEPKQISIRVGKTSWVGYGLGDVSGNGFEDVLKIGDILYFQYGQ